MTHEKWITNSSREQVELFKLYRLFFYSKSTCHAVGTLYAAVTFATYVRKKTLCLHRHDGALPSVTHGSAKQVFCFHSLVLLEANLSICLVDSYCRGFSSKVVEMFENLPNWPNSASTLSTILWFTYFSLVSVGFAFRYIIRWAGITLFSLSTCPYQSQSQWVQYS